MTPEEGAQQIDQALWERGDGYANLHITDAKGRPVLAWLSLRPTYCDRGHIQLQVDGIPDLDAADSFPRYFFSFEEADAHARTFLKWRIWKKRTHPHTLSPS
jgi:hypothetical protein